MTPLTPDQWIMLVLVFVLGLLIGMFVMAGGRWKRRYREEVQRNEILQAENKRLHSEAREMESLRNAAAKHPPQDAREPVQAPARPDPQAPD